MDLRDPGRDYELYKYTCQELQRLMAEIQDLKSRGGKDAVRSGRGRTWVCMDGSVLHLSQPFLILVLCPAIIRGLDPEVCSGIPWLQEHCPYTLRIGKGGLVLPGP